MTRPRLAMLTVAAVALAGCVAEVTDVAIADRSQEARPPRAADLPAGDDTIFERVIDGDTVVVTGGERVRLIGIDTPETRHPDRGVECFGREASAHTERLLPPGEPVRLVYDVERRDRYGRTLAHLYRLRDGLHVNAALVADGYAQVATYPPNVAPAHELLELQRTARAEGRGLWSACDLELPPMPTVADGCDPSYPDVCIAPPPPVLNCGDIPHRRFAVLPPDPHGFDGNRNGIGCQS
jgi:micrococcal nuclease